MWVIQLAFGDDDRRLEARSAHRERLASMKREGLLVMAGPFGDDSGALILLDVADEAEARKVIADDGYYSTPGVDVVAVREWRPLDL